MKKILAILLAVTMLLSFAGCGAKPVDEAPVDGTEIEENVDGKDEVTDKTQTEDNKPAEKEEGKKEDAKKEESAQKTEEKPTEKPEEKPAETAKTVGNILLADFKTKAGSQASVLSIAEGLIENSIIPFMGGAMEVEPGLLAGFGNTEITGFKSGATFMPMMGSIAFVGYVFELENGTNVNDFIAKLKSSADLRWNVCVEAEEMVTGSVGNKVFFVMCPKAFEE